MKNVQMNLVYDMTLSFI